MIQLSSPNTSRATRHSFAFIILSILLSAYVPECQNANKEEPEHTPGKNLDQSQAATFLTKHREQSIFLEQYATHPDTAYVSIFLTGDHQYSILNFKIEGNTPVILGGSNSFHPQGAYHRIPDDASIIEIGNELYLYYNYCVDAGNQNTTYEFVLYSLSDNYQYSIIYTTYDTPWGPVGEFSEQPDLGPTRDLYMALKQRAVHSVYYIDNSKDLYRPEKAAERWRTDNPSCHTDLRKHGIYDARTVKYMDNLFRSYAVGSTTDSVVNTDFIVISKFKGPVIALERASGFSFIVWVPEMGEWARSLAINDGYNLYIDHVLKVNLVTNQIVVVE